MGEFANGLFTNAVLVIAIICSLYLSWEAGQEMWSDIQKG
jgi:hypothetical protein